MHIIRRITCLCLITGLAGQVYGADREAVVRTYADIAHAAFSDSHQTALQLKAAVDDFLDAPSRESHADAKQAWLAARLPYGQTEVFRFGNPNVDDWEGQVNAWPLDEGLIDYVRTDTYEHEEGNRLAAHNIVAGSESITPALLISYQEKGGSEANVATGYHAIEFLLWGQDLNARPTDSGLRPYTDFVAGEGCTHGHCQRRAQYLRAATRLLVADLEQMAADWAPGSEANYRAVLLAEADKSGLRRMLFGMGSLSLGELAGERINVALLAGSQEDEHSCFSDNTHVDIAENARGIRNVYLGAYRRTDGSMVRGPSLSDLVRAADPDLDAAMRKALDDSQQKAGAIEQAARDGEHFDQQIESGNKAGRQRVRAVVRALKAQAARIVDVAAALGISSLDPENSDSLGG